MISEISNRYAKALFELSTEKGSRTKQILKQLCDLRDLFEKNHEFQDFLKFPMTKVEDKKNVLITAFKEANVLPEVESFLLLLAEKDRLSFFSEILESFQNLVDKANGVTRGVVRSTTVLSQGDREKIEDTVSRYTKKNVILTYKEDKELLGGLIAEVGSYTFDDTLASHLKRLKEELKRRVH